MQPTAKIPKITDFYFDAICLENCKITYFISFEKGQKVQIHKMIVKFADADKPEKYSKTIKVGKNQTEKQIEVINKDGFYLNVGFSFELKKGNFQKGFYTLTKEQHAFFNIFPN